MGKFNVFAYNDTFVSKYSSSKNYNYKEYLCAGKTLRNNVYSDLLISFLNFDIYRKCDALDIVSAKLYLHLDSDFLDNNKESEISLGIYEILQPYNAEIVTWISAPEIKVTSYNINNMPTHERKYISVDITELLRRWDSILRPICGIALVGKMMRQTVTITSSRGEYRPYIEIEIETIEKSNLNFGVSSITGATGATGAQGPRGIPGGPIGPIGVQGPIGPQGLQGIPGSQGNRGLDGPQGNQGPEGAQGRQGAPGPIGPMGPVGIMGPVGPQGPIGPEGKAGIAGPKGERGGIGIQGEQGPIGAQGPQGVRGSTGVQGPIGLIGVTGATGNVGIQGPPGPQGPQGPFGFKGDAGEQGIQGIQGVTGAKGDVGATGPSVTGEKGNSIVGERGQIGQTGIQGEIGPTGSSITGATGATGKAGVTGATGTMGLPGRQGIQGRRGEQGIQGMVGPIGDKGMTPIIPTTNNAQLVNIIGGEIRDQDFIKLTPVVINGTDINEYEECLSLLPNHTYYVNWRISSSLSDIYQTFAGQLILDGVDIEGSFNKVGPVFCAGDVITAYATVIFTVQDNVSILRLQYLATGDEGVLNNLTYSSLNIMQIS